MSSPGPKEPFVTERVSETITSITETLSANTPGAAGKPGERLAAELAAERPLLAGLSSSLAGLGGDAASLEATLAATSGSALETVVAMRRGRPASPRLFSGSGPLVARGPVSGTQSRAGSTPGTARHATGMTAVKTVQDSAILNAVRRQMEALEDKLSGQINRVQQQSDRLQNAALTRVDQKMVTMEALQPKLDRRIAELSGNYKGLSDEMQAQIRRLDQMDSRLWEWRHQLEEEVRNKFVEIEQCYQRVSSSVRVTTASNEDALKRHNQRVVHLEGLLEERLQAGEEIHHGISSLHERLEQVENFRMQELALFPDPSSRALAVPDSTALSVDSASLMTVETRLSDACSKISTLQEESHDLYTRMEAQEVLMKSLQTRVENKEEHYRWLNDRVERCDWESRFKEIQAHMTDIQTHRTQQGEDIELLRKRLESSDQATEECVDHLRKIYVERTFLSAEASVRQDIIETDAQAGSVLAQQGEALSLDMKDCVTRIIDLEARAESQNAELQAMRTDVALAPRVAALVEQLKDVAPKVIEQEHCVRDLLEKVGSLDVEYKMNKTSEQGKVECTDKRIQRLEADYERLSESMTSWTKQP